MKKIVFATGNAGKMKEIREILADLPVEIYSMKEAGISVEIDENGKTFEENAKIKAQTVAGCTDGDTIVLAILRSGSRCLKRRAWCLFGKIYGRGYVLPHQKSEPR